MNFTTTITTIDETNNTIKCKLVFNALSNNYCSIDIYDSKKRYFYVPRSWKLYNHYCELEKNKKFDLHFHTIEGCLCIFLEGYNNRHDTMYIQEDTTTDKHLYHLLHQKKDLYEQIDQINKHILSIKNEYLFDNENEHEHECNMCHEYYNVNKMYETLPDEYYCYDCLCKNNRAKKCCECLSIFVYDELIEDSFNDIYCFECFNVVYDKKNNKMLIIIVNIFKLYFYKNYRYEYMKLFILFLI